MSDPLTQEELLKRLQAIQDQLADLEVGQREIRTTLVEMQLRMNSLTAQKGHDDT